MNIMHLNYVNLKPRLEAIKAYKYKYGIRSYLAP